MIDFHRIFSLKNIGTNCSFMHFASSDNEKIMRSTYCSFMRFTSSHKITCSTYCSLMAFATSDNNKFTCVTTRFFIVFLGL